MAAAVLPLLLTTFAPARATNGTYVKRWAATMDGGAAAQAVTLDQAVNDGAKAVVGGRIPEHLPKGYYYEPTMLVGVDENAPVAQDELFGPVLVVLPHDGDDDAVCCA